MVVGILNSFTSFDLVYVMTNGGPGPRHRADDRLLPAGFGQTRFDYAAALTVVQFLLLVVLTVMADERRAATPAASSADHAASSRRPPGSPPHWPRPRHHGVCRS